MSKFVIEQKKDGNKLVVVFKNDFNEDADFQKLEVNDSTELEIDFNAVTSINSCGIRDWVRWTKSLPAGTKINFKNCPKIIIEQINMIDGFLPASAFVTSFKIPYFCESCENITDITVQKGKDYNGADVKCPETTACSKCGNKAELDIMEARYFKFLKAKG